MKATKYTKADNEGDKLLMKATKTDNEGDKIYF